MRSVNTLKWLWSVLLLSVLIGITFSPSWGDPLDTWHWRNPSPQGNHLNSVAWGNNTYVAVGYGDSILTSPDGVTWTRRSLGTTAWLFGITYGNGTFVAVGDSGAIYTSPDGVTWTPRNSGDYRLQAVTWGNNTFVAVGHYYDSSGVILTSPDGVTWTPVNSVFQDLKSVAWGNNIFVIPGYTSPDGKTWTPNSGSPGMSGITFGNGIFVGVEGRYDTRIIYTSTNGTDWTTIDLGNGNNGYLAGVTWGNSTFIAVGFEMPNHLPVMLTSPDGIIWTPVTSPSKLQSRAVTWGGSSFVAVGAYGNILTSPDAKDWAIRTADPMETLTDLTYGNETFVAVGDTGTILTSPDGAAWALRDSGTTSFLAGVTWGNGLFVAVGDGGTLVSSDDGAIWSQRSSGTTAKLYGVAWNGSIFVAVGLDGTILTSADSITWSPRPAGSDNLFAVAWGNGTFVAVGGDTILTSPNGTAWTPQILPVTDAWLRNVAWGNGSFVAVGNDGAVLTSPDGVTWTPRSFQCPQYAPCYLYDVTWANDTFVAVGYWDTIHTSPDGITWTKRNSGTINPAAGVCYGNNTFVVVGGGGTILQSAPLQPTLTILRTGSGAGTVTSSPAGISCGTVCSKSFSKGATVTLTATPDAESTFAGWSGGNCSGTDACTVPLNGDTTVTATFAIKPPAASFTASPTTGKAPYTVAFSDLSSRATSWLWSFGDGTSSTLRNPSHAYKISGSYTVSLAVINPTGFDTIQKSGYISVTSCDMLPVRIDRPSPAYFATINAAIAEAADGETLRLRDTILAEGLTLDKSIILDGGYECTFAGRTGYAELNHLIVSGGEVTINNIIIN